MGPWGGSWRPRLLLGLLLGPAAGLLCSEDTYPHGNRCCRECQPGYGMERRCDRWRDTVCQLCPSGFYNEDVNYETCKPCTQCNARSGSEVQQACTSTRDTVCRCRPGTQTQDGYKHGVDCAPCPPGHFSPGRDEPCKPWTDCASVGKRTLRPASNSSDAICEDPSPPPKPAGSTQPATARPTSRRPTSPLPTSPQLSTAPTETPRGAALGLGLGLLAPTAAAAAALGLALCRRVWRPPRKPPGGSSFRTPIQEEHTDACSILTKI
ncbi:tumor necrosis factor receptor superfamily member 4 [Dasypus novemcinctus]|uniref:tumor necrosis factor receptor superfamily member 4 n=1 Tax=Dasypus novemcinctus TaxID=9361 RepID=UPI00265EB9F7|nr:tumor necrosis factor receptor superfamily member 4 isoform X2 [Dasypus novemcinctus]